MQFDYMNTLSKFLHWIADNPAEGIILIIVIYWIFKRIKENKKEVLMQAAIYLVAQAENEWNSKEGKIKFADVYSALQRRHPIITFFFSKDTIQNIINEALDVFRRTMKNKDNIVAMDKIVNDNRKIISQQEEIVNNMNSVIEEQQTLAVQVNSVLNQEDYQSSL